MDRCVQEFSRNQVNCDRTQQTQQGQGVQDLETAHVVSRLAGSSITEGKGDLYQIRATHTETHPNQRDRVKISTRSTLIPTTVKFGIDSSPPGRVQYALPTFTQGKEGKAHGIGVLPPLVGRLAASGELGSPHKMSASRSTTTCQEKYSDALHPRRLWQQLLRSSSESIKET